jgi:DnaJ-class molecular chaperone
MDLETAYRVLEVHRGASGKELRDAYLHLVQVWHPDRLNTTLSSGIGPKKS